MRKRQTRLPGIYFAFNSALTLETVRLRARSREQADSMKRRKVSGELVGAVPEVSIDQELSGKNASGEDTVLRHLE